MVVAVLVAAWVCHGQYLANKGRESDFALAVWNRDLESAQSLLTKYPGLARATDMIGGASEGLRTQYPDVPDSQEADERISLLALCILRGDGQAAQLLFRHGARIEPAEADHLLCEMRFMRPLAEGPPYGFAVRSRNWDCAAVLTKCLGQNPDVYVRIVGADNWNGAPQAYDKVCEACSEFGVQALPGDQSSPDPCIIVNLDRAEPVSEDYAICRKSTTWKIGPDGLPYQPDVSIGWGFDAATGVVVKGYITARSGEMRLPKLHFDENLPPPEDLGSQVVDAGARSSSDFNVPGPPYDNAFENAGLREKTLVLLRAMYGCAGFDTLTDTTDKHRACLRKQQLLHGAE